MWFYSLKIKGFLGGKNGSYCLMGGKMGKVLVVDGGDGCTTMLICLMPLTAQLKVAKMVNLCYVYFTTIKKNTKGFPWLLNRHKSPGLYIVYVWNAKLRSAFLRMFNKVSGVSLSHCLRLLFPLYFITEPPSCEKIKIRIKEKIFSAYYLLGHISSKINYILFFTKIYFTHQWHQITFTEWHF